MLSADTREEQATACLEAAERHREPLLALATKLAGCPEEGMELFQQAVLNCHDAIQRNGFAGERYEFYLYTSLRNYFLKQQRHQSRERRVDFQQAESGSSTRDDEGPAPWVAKARSSWEELSTLTAARPASSLDPHAQLAEQVMAEVQQQFSWADRVALRLSLDGLSCQQIAEHIGKKDQSYVWRRLQRMKEQLRQTFQQAWEALADTDE